METQNRLPGHNVVEVLAGACRGRRTRTEGWTHYEVPGTNDALCGKVQKGGLTDEFGSEDDGERLPTCPHCLRAARKIGSRPL
jgi:hypothetical protein